MAWVFLIIAGLLETGWAAGLKAVALKPSCWLIITTAAMLAASMAMLAISMRAIPLAVAYPVWTGVGSVGAVLAGALLFKETLEPMRVIGVLFLCAGMMLISARPAETERSSHERRKESGDVIADVHASIGRRGFRFHNRQRER